MITEIFTDKERKMLEAHLTNAKVDEAAISELFDLIKNHEILFEDVFLYLQIRKTITS
jgi:hypothetical protein